MPGDQIITNNKRLYNGMTTDGGGLHTINKPHRLGKLRLTRTVTGNTQTETEADTGTMTENSLEANRLTRINNDRDMTDPKQVHLQRL